MHRLVIRAVEEFLRDTYGEALWRDVATAEGARPIAPPEPGGGQPGSPGRIAHGEALITSAAIILEKPAEELFEDLGAWLARREAIRRLLRFSGRDFGDFVLSLEELPGRTRYVIPDLDMPRIEVARDGDGTIRLILAGAAQGWTAILGGLLRAMADDYGALGLIVVEGCEIDVHISDHAFAEGREFRLGQACLRTELR